MSIRTVQTTNLGLRKINPDGYTFPTEPSFTPSTWKRNPAWLSMPSVSNTESKVVILMAIEKESNYVSMLFQGAYTVDWGDGSTPENVANNTQCNYSYDYSNTVFDGTDGSVTFTDSGDLVTRNNHGYSNNDIIWFNEITSTTGISTFTDYYVINTTTNTFQLSSTSGGSALPLTTDGSGKILSYKQVLITVTPQGGDTLRFLNFNRRHSTVASVTTADSNWLDVIISGPNITWFGFNQATQNVRHARIKRVQVLSTGALANTTFAFNGLSELDNISTFNANTSIVSNAYGMFQSCRNLEVAPSMNTSSFVNMTLFFADCSNLKEIPNYDTSLVTGFGQFLSGCSSIEKIPHINASSALSCGAMFNGCRSLYKVSLNTSTSLANTAQMFVNCTKLEEIPYFETSGVTNMSEMFSGCSSIETIPPIVTGNATLMSTMFNGCSALKKLPETLDTKNNTSLNSTFFGCVKLEEIPMLDTSKVTNMGNTFYGCRILKIVPGLETGNVTNMDRTHIFNHKLLKYPEYTNTSLVTTMNAMFQDCYVAEGAINYETGNCTNISGMFSSNYKLVTAPTLNTSKVTTFSNTFSFCYSLATVPLYDTSNATSTYAMFTSCSDLFSLPNFDTSKVTNAVAMFESCVSLAKAPALNISNAQYISSLFSGCRNLTYIPSTYNTTKVIDGNRIFHNCNSIRDLPPAFINMGGNATSFANTFQNSLTLNEVPAINCFSITNFANWLSGAQNVSKINAYNIRASFTANCKLSNTSLTSLCDNNLLANTAATITINGATGAGSLIGTTVGATTSGCTVITMTSTTNFTVGNEVTGTNTPLTTPIAVTFQDTGDTVTLNNHQLSNNDQVSFASITSTTGIVINTIYYVVNTTTNTFQVSDTAGGGARTLTTNGSGTMRYRAEVASINPGVSITLNRPCTGTGSALTIQNRTGGAKVGGALLRGWTVA